MVTRPESNSQLTLDSFIYHKNSKNQDTNYGNYHETVCFYSTAVCPKDIEGVANSGDVFIPIFRILL